MKGRGEITTHAPWPLIISVADSRIGKQCAGSASQWLVDYLVPQSWRGAPLGAGPNLVQSTTWIQGRTFLAFLFVQFL